MTVRIAKKVADWLFVVLLVAIYFLGAVLLQRVALTQIENSGVLLLSAGLIFSYREAMTAAFREKDLGYLWFSRGLALLFVATIINVGSGTVFYVMGSPSNGVPSEILPFTRGLYLASYSCFYIAKWAGKDSIPARGWLSLFGLITLAAATTGFWLWFAGS
jgi:hypothetical protein